MSPSGRRAFGWRLGSVVEDGGRAAMAIDDQGLVHTDEEDEEEYVEDGEYEEDEELDDEGDNVGTSRLSVLRNASQCMDACSRIL